MPVNRFRPLILCLAVLACADRPSVSAVRLDALVIRDSTYLDPETLEPFTGRVEKTFDDDPEQLQLRGELIEGLWNGEIVVYHPNGRIRYLGSLADGVKCGEWIENRDPDPPGDLLQEFKQEIESLGLYPPCPER